MHKNRFPLEERTLRFTKDIREFIRRVPRTIGAIEDAKQLVHESEELAAILGAIIRNSGLA